MQVGDGRNIRVWEDFWLLGVLPRRLISPCSHPSSHPNMRVSEIINHSVATWNVDKLNALFQHEDVDLRFNLSDQYVWPNTTNLEYTAKSGYWTVTHDFMDENPIIPPEGSLVLKAQKWKLEILSKIQQFLWKAISGALPTYIQLCSRGINTDPVCRDDVWRKRQSVMFCFPVLIHKQHGDVHVCRY